MSETLTSLGLGPDLARVGRGLLEAITRALRAFAEADDATAALRDSFRAVAEGVGAQRAFLAKVAPDRRVVTEVLAAEGLSTAQIEALRCGTSSPGVSPTLIRTALQSGRAQVVEDARLAARHGDLTGSLAGGEYSVVCAAVADPYTRQPLAVLYLQSSSITEPLIPALVPYVEAYTVALAHAWHAWDRSRHALTQAVAERAAGDDLEIVGDSDATHALRKHLHRIVIPAMAAERPDPILILGPTGTGKDLLARYLHACSARAKGRFVALNCASFAGEVLESTLFGHIKGAFTGATGPADGAFVAADNGLLFLDELGDMPAQGQGLLLRALESRRVRPLGGRDERPVNVQIVGATNRDLEAEIQAGRFRADLYHRVKGLTVYLEALADRPDDIAPLLSHYLRFHERRLGKRTPGLAPDVLEHLRAYAWPGNVRELFSVCSRLVLHAEPTRPIDAAVLRQAAPEVLGDPTHTVQRMPAGTLADVRAACERAHVERVARELGWNKTAMARRLGINRTAVHALIKRLALEEDNEDDA